MTTKKSTKRALLMSALSILLCVSMLIGTTYAWFTDSVTSAGNIIKSGTLDVEMYWAEGEKDVPAEDSADWKDASTTKIFDYDKWEPGYVAVRHIKIANEGTLALKYQLKIIADGEVSELADVIDVYFVDPAAKVADRTALTDANKVDTLTNVLAGMPANMSGELLEDEYATVTIALKMQESAGNEYQDKSIGADFAVMLFATQLTSEKDSFDDQYDAGAKYDRDVWDGKSTVTPVADANGVYRITSAAELVGMMNDSKYSNCNKYQNVVLENNIDLAGRTVSGFGDDSGFFDGIFDGQGYTISNFIIDATNREYYAGLFNQVSQYSGENTVIKNLTVANATIKGTSQVGAIAGGMNGNTIVDNCKAINCTLSAVKKVGSVVGYTAGGTVTNNYAENCVVLYSEKEGGEILGFENTGSTVNNNVAKNVTLNMGSVAATSDELIEAIKSAPVGKESVILLADGTFEGDIAITVAALGASGGDVVIKASADAKPVIAGTVTLGYRNQGTGATMYDANVTFEGITFDHANAASHSLNIQDVKSLTLKDCTIIGDGEYGVTCARGNATGTSKIVNCTFKNAGMQLLGNFATGLVIDECTFEESCINVQAGNGVTVQNCTFNKTLTAANVGDSFYAIRSNSTPITVKNCKLSIDSKLTEVATSQSKWYLFANRGSTNWTVENVAVTMTVAALMQTELVVTACTSTGTINTTNLTVNGVAV